MSINLYKYRVWCNDEQGWFNIWDTTDPTTCPNHADHTIDTTKTTIIQKKKAVEPTDKSGKTRVHQTSRKLGLRIMWFGEGDDTSNILNVGGGHDIIGQHSIGEGDTPIYIDWNVAENETFIHEGYVTWKDCNMDRVTLEIVPRVTATEVSSGTNYNIVNGFLIVPAAGDGTTSITADITNPNNGLIYMPNDDEGNPPVAYWNADYNSSTQLYENITAAPDGNGRYNMFSTEVPLIRFLHRMPLLANGFMALNSSDTDEIGHGMRLKLTPETAGTDHDWSIASLICMHRNRSTIYG